MGDSKGVSRGLLLWIFYAGMFWVLALLIPNVLLFTLEWVIGTLPLWAPFLLFYAAMKAWVWYVQSFYLAGQEAILLEMKLPHEVTRSPHAMELALIPFAISAGETTFISRAWNGGVRPIWSLEIASFGGDVHFYIWCWKSWKPTVEAALYAYYPEIELFEVEDYAQKFKFDPAIHDTYCTEWRRESFGVHVPKPGDFNINAYPYKTYIDFELDKDPEEEFKIDPLASVVEFLGGIPPEQQIWLQISFKMAWWVGVFRTDNTLTQWRDAVEEEVKNVRLNAAITFEPGSPEGKKYGPSPRVALSWHAAHLIENMERQLTKYPYDVGMRGWVVSSKKLTANDYMGMRWIWRAYGDPQYSTHIRPRRWHPPFDYPWQDFHNIRWNTAVRRYLDAYRRRMFWHTPWILPTNVLSNEEIASLWHPISGSVATPGLERMEAKKHAPPHNLPM